MGQRHALSLHRQRLLRPRRRAVARQGFPHRNRSSGTFAAGDNVATPLEFVLSSLASCLTAGVVAVAQHRSIQLHSVSATIEGDMDLQGILGIDDEVRNGFGNIRVHFNIDADGDEDDLKALVVQSQKRSAVFNIITNPTNVFVFVS